jgi:N-acetyl-beta-hexosaminidase
MTRGLMLDCARRFYSLDFLAATVVKLQSAHYDTLHLHLTDNAYDEGTVYIRTGRMSKNGDN